jgi:hypothetical protein
VTFDPAGNLYSTEAGIPSFRSRVMEFDQPACLAGDSDCDGFLNPQQTQHLGPSNTDALTDNCPANTNISQLNSDGNFIDLTPPKSADDKTWPNSDAAGDACDSDDDNDGLSDTAEASGCGFDSTNPVVRDSDGDRFLDGAECALGTNPNDASSKPALSACGATTDADGDGLQLRIEYCFYNSNPLSANTDGDGCGDGREVASVNNDMTVSAADLGLVASEFGANYPTGSYKVAFDVNKDGSITSADLGFVASKFGPCP